MVIIVVSTVLIGLIFDLFQVRRYSAIIFSPSVLVLTSDAFVELESPFAQTTSSLEYNFWLSGWDKLIESLMNLILRRLPILCYIVSVTEKEPYSVCSY